MVNNRELFNEARDFLSSIDDIRIDARGYIKLFDDVPSPYNIDTTSKVIRKTQTGSRYGVIIEPGRSILNEPAHRIVKRELIQDCIINGYVPDNDLYLLPIYIDRCVVPCAKSYGNKSGAIGPYENVYYKFNDGCNDWNIIIDIGPGDVIFAPIDLLKRDGDDDYRIKLHIKVRRPVEMIIRDKRILWRESIRPPYEPLYVTVDIDLILDQYECKHIYSSINSQLTYTQDMIDKDYRYFGHSAITEFDSTLKCQKYCFDEPYETPWEVIEQEYLLTSKRKPKTFDPSSIHTPANQLVDLTMIPESV